MSKENSFNPSINDSGYWRKGVVMGIAGGVAEVVVVTVNSEAGGTSVVRVGSQISAAVGLSGGSAWLGLGIHLALAVALGIGMSYLWRRVSAGGARSVPLYPSMLLLLAMVWAVNFFVVLPVVSPIFVGVLPYSISLMSKLTFGAAAAAAWQFMSKGHNASVNNASSRMVRANGT